VLELGKSTVYRTLRRDAKGEPLVQRKPCSRALLKPRELRWLRSLSKCDEAAYLDELQYKLFVACGKHVSVPTVCRGLAKLGLRRKKVRCPWRGAPVYTCASSAPSQDQTSPLTAWSTLRSDTAVRWSEANASARSMLPTASATSSGTSSCSSTRLATCVTPPTRRTRRRLAPGCLLC
jgi:hypothetical protein